MKKIYINVFLYSLIIFSIYSAFIIGFAWDESAVISIAKLRLRYLSSLGAVEYKPLWFSHYYPGTYPVIAIFITQLFHKSYELEVLHILNTLIGISTIFGVSKIAREFFNKKIGYIVFLISFFNPIFFGHMAINERDLVIAFCNIWMVYTLIKYLKYHHIKEKKNKFVIILGVLFGLGLSCRLSFFVTLLPIIIFLFFDSFYIRKFCNKKLIITNFIKDVLLSLLIAYLVLIIFWPEVYTNILILPFKFFLASLDFRWGTAQGLINGIFFDPMHPPKNYLLIFLFYKMPEYLIASYFIFFLVLFKNSSFFIKKFDYFYYKIFLIILIVIFPNFLLIISPYPIYDNLRLFLYIIPYLSIIPAIFIFYLFDNLNLKINKVLITFVLVLFFYSVYNFFLLTPYQYTYLNTFSGKFSESHRKFESDYWGTSMKQLIKKANLKKNIRSNIAVCGMAKHRVKYYLKKFGFKNIDVVSIHENYDYIIMTNRVFWQKNTDDLKDLKTCYEQFPGKTISSVKRKGLALSLIRSREI